LKLAAIDIGSNSIKLVIIDGVSDSFVVLRREKEVVRLGHDTLKNKYLSQEAIDRAANAILRFRSIAEPYGVDQVVAIATASVREADNATEFTTQIKNLTGVDVDILSGIEEARLIGLAAAYGCASRGIPILNIDIGGGSTELSLMQDSMPTYLYSVKLGAVGLTEQFIASDPVSSKDLQALKKEIRTALERPARELARLKWEQTTGTSGTILAIGEALSSNAQRLQVTGPLRIHPSNLEISIKNLEEFNRKIATFNSSERQYIPGISLQRSEIIIAGSHILEGAMRALGIHTLKTCDWALREGAIIDRLRMIEAEMRAPIPDIADPRLHGVHVLGMRFGYEESHAHHVALLAEKLFDKIAPVYKLRRHDRTLLSAAALLHDIGYYIAHESHHKHTQYLIKHSELTGFSETDRLIISNIARYHRRALPKDKHQDYALLSENDRALVWNDLHCIPNGSTIEIQLHSALTACDKEIEEAESRKDMFEKAFSCKISFTGKSVNTFP
jgi:exopolyphosphatase / guanosine-5'-triphosphate,3'-diphosphate pyrophosphatase